MGSTRADGVTSWHLTDAANQTDDHSGCLTRHGHRSCTGLQRPAWPTLCADTKNCVSFALDEQPKGFTTAKVCGGTSCFPSSPGVKLRRQRLRGEWNPHRRVHVKSAQFNERSIPPSPGRVQATPLRLPPGDGGIDRNSFARMGRLRYACTTRMHFGSLVCHALIGSSCHRVRAAIDSLSFV